MKSTAVWVTVCLPLSIILTAEVQGAGGQSPSGSQVGTNMKKDWTRVGDLGQQPRHVHQDLPLSDQSNSGHWVLDKRFCDEFKGKSLNLKRWHVLPTSPDDWKGREPAMFLPSNVTVKNGTLSLAFRKGDVPEMNGLKGYKDYTSCAIKTYERSGYGYYEARTRPCRSSASSGFWLTDTGREDYKSEIDIFEIGANSPKFMHKYNMTLHVWGTPQSKEHWGRMSEWITPWNFADEFHTYGFEWDKDYCAWYIDGVPVRTAVNTDWFYPMQIYFDVEAQFPWFGGVNDADLPAFFDIKYLRVWRHKEAS
jgi:beta-glucanase (GH16 family)